MSNKVEESDDGEMFQDQLKQELQKLFEEHNKQINSELERFKNEKLELQAKFEKEMNELREKHLKDIEQEEKSQNESSKLSKQIFTLQVDEIINPKGNEIINQHTLLIDERINKLNDQLKAVVRRLKHLPEVSQNEEEYKQLRSVYKLQSLALLKLVNIMKNSCHYEVKELFTKHAIIDRTYYNLFQTSIDSERK